jgi:5-methylcytosine-specific restriction enzyme A
MKQGRPYDRQAWRLLRRTILVRDGYCCVKCGRLVQGKGAARVDHIERVRDNPARMLDPTNLRTLCPTCDNRSHIEKRMRVPYRVERTVYGCDELGRPIDPSHPWRQAPSE